MALAEYRNAPGDARALVRREFVFALCVLCAQQAASQGNQNDRAAHGTASKNQLE
jgi:hypothetical protein